MLGKARKCFFWFPFVWGDNAFILEALQNLTLPGREQPAAADSALSRSSRLDGHQTYLMLMLTNSLSVMNEVNSLSVMSEVQWESIRSISSFFTAMLPSLLLTHTHTKKIQPKKAVPIFSPVVRATQQSQGEQKTGDSFTVHLSCWMPRTLLTPPFILCEKGDRQLHGDVLVFHEYLLQ